MRGDTIRANFGAGRFFNTTEAWQWDYGLELEISGLTLPDVFEVHFSNQATAGTTTTQIGQDNRVIIPDAYLTTGENVFAFIYLHEGESDGETEYKIMIPVKQRPKPTNATPTPVQQDAITEAIAALNAAVTQTGEDVQTTQGYMERAETAAGNAEGYASDASRSEGNASDYATNAANSAHDAGESAETASGASQTATEQAGLASGYATSANTNALKSEGYAVGTQNGVDVGSGSPYYHNNSKYYSEQSEGSAISAASSATNAGTSATNAANSATEANTAKTAAQTAQTAAEAAAQTLVIDDTLTQANQAADAKKTGDEISDLKGALDAIIEAEGLHKYGVSGIGQSASALTRIWDSVGMTAQVGTDGDNSNVVNNFDDVTPFNRRKCVGHWALRDDRAQFIVEAYQGDADYAEDGSMGDYVAVECPRAYYYLKDGILGVSAHHYQGWQPFDIFCHNHNTEETLEYAYLPAYALAIKDGHAVSLPGLDNEQGDYAKLFNAARTYNNSDVKGLAMLQSWAINFYEWALYTVEFAQQVPTNVMFGCLKLRSNDADTVVFTDSTHAITNSYQTARVVGEYIAITATAGHTNVNYQATHKITAITRCDEDGVADTSGTHQLLELEDLGKAYFAYEVGTTYYLAARPWRTGLCNSVSTPSGSPVSNSSGYYPMKYRHRENIYGNQYSTIVDLFNRRVQDANEQSYLEWYYLPEPSKITTPSNSVVFPSENYVKLDVETSPSNYINGYIKDRQYASEYPDVWIPGQATGASASTYYAVSAYLVTSYAVRACRFGGYWSSGSVYLNATYAPSTSYASFGGDLCFPQ